MTLYLDVDEKTQNCRNLFGEEIYEKSEFQLKVASLYRQYVDSGDFRVVDARGTQMEVLQQIKSKLSEIM
jgi:thymidylate kinase